MATDRSEEKRVSRGSWRGLATLSLLLWGAAAGCQPAPQVEGGRLSVVSTTGMVADLVERIGGDRVRVTSLMGPGVDPHLYKASAGAVRLLAEARVIFYSGLHLEAALAELLEQMDGRTRTRAVTDAIPSDRLLTPSEFQGQIDPHVWSDVSLWIYAADAILETLIEVDPEGEGEYRARAELLRAEMEEVDRWVREEVGRVPPDRRVLVTAHDAFHYFGAAYGFEVLGLQGISTAAEAGTGDVQRLATLIVERSLPAIFIESSIPIRNIEAVQAAVRARGGEVRIGGMLYSDALGDPETEAGSYLGMIRHNTRTIVAALTGEGGV